MSAAPPMCVNEMQMPVPVRLYIRVLVRPVSLAYVCGGVCGAIMMDLGAHG